MPVVGVGFGLGVGLGVGVGLGPGLGPGVVPPPLVSPEVEALLPPHPSCRKMHPNNNPVAQIPVRHFTAEAAPRPKLSMENPFQLAGRFSGACSMAG